MARLLRIKAKIRSIRPNKESRPRRLRKKQEKKTKETQKKQNRQEKQDGSPVIMEANAIQATKGQKIKQRNSQSPKKNISDITYYNSNKKSHYSRNYIKPKN